MDILYKVKKWYRKHYGLLAYFDAFVKLLPIERKDSELITTTYESIYHSLFDSFLYKRDLEDSLILIEKNLYYIKKVWHHSLNNEELKALESCIDCTTNEIRKLLLTMDLHEIY